MGQETVMCVQDGPARMRVQRALLQLMMQLLLATWSARIRYHGPRPVPAANRVRYPIGPA
jgi:hypothetical protein